MIEKLIIEDGFYMDNEGVPWESKVDYLQSEHLDLCGCGNPDDVMLYIKGLLEKIENGDYGDYKDMPYMLFVNWADEKGYIEHGTTIRCPWLTDYGKEILEDIKLISKETK